MFVSSVSVKSNVYIKGVEKAEIKTVYEFNSVFFNTGIILYTFDLFSLSLDIRIVLP